MLLQHYYTVCRQDLQQPECRFQVVLHEDSPVYEGHFPGQPIAPGVANIQMIKELAESVLQQQLTIVGIKQCKFLKPVRPDEHRPLDVLLTVNADQLAAEMLDGETTIMKLKAQIA